MTDLRSLNYSCENDGNKSSVLISRIFQLYLSNLSSWYEHVNMRILNLRDLVLLILYVENPQQLTLFLFDFSQLKRELA